MFVTRSRISLAALFVNVTANIDHGMATFWAIRWASLAVKTLVFPVPAPARTSTAPSTASTASNCFEFNPCKYPTLDVLPASLELDPSSAFMSGIYAIIPAC